MTKKEARGGDARWKLGHLPAGTDKKFTELVVPAAKIMAGTLPPWVGLDYNQVQTVVDSVFGKGEIVVSDGDVWCGLVSFPSFYKHGLTRFSCTRFQLASATGVMDLQQLPLKLSTNSRTSIPTCLTLLRRSKSVSSFTLQ